MTARPRTLTLRGATYPVVLPNIRDPRLHVAAVIISVHVLGQVGLGFAVSVPQILAAILTSAVIEVVLTFRSAKAFVWPASAMLTGSGVALILRVVGTAPDDHWTTYAWEVFAVVAGLSLLSKYVIRYRGSHVFNPSNVGLVVTFVVLGSARVEPLDFWWAPLTPSMLAAYAVILGGGLLITRRLGLLGLAAAFFVTLAAGVGLLAGSGHCMIANWAFAPVCGADFTRVILTSPEVMIFLFFMITDPKTIPTGRVGRLVFGVLVGITCVLLMAPQTDEFGTKVGLLAGLVLVCAARPVLERFLPEPKSGADDLRAFARRLATGGVASPGLARIGARALAAVVVVAVVGAGVVVAGTPARAAGTADPTETLNRLPRQIDPATLPAITVGQDVATYDPTLTGDGMQQVAVTLAQNLELERLALLRRDRAILPAIDHGDRLAELQRRLDAAVTGGPITVERYRFDTIEASLILPFGAQTGLVLGLTGTGTLSRETLDASGALVGTESTPFRLTFAMRRATGSRWLNVGVLRPEDVQRP